MMVLESVSMPRAQTWVLAVSMIAGAAVYPVSAQDASPEQAQAAGPPVESRVALIEQQQAEKAASLVPAKPDKAEAYVTRISDIFLAGQMHWHAFFHSAYSGGGFTLGAGYTQFVSPNNTLDMRGSITPSGYKRVEAEFIAPGLFGRRGTLSAIGGWREATQVGFYGFGMTSTKDARTNFSFQQPYASTTLDVRPKRNPLFVRGTLEITQWKQAPGSGSAPSVETVYTPQTLPGLGAQPVYLHTRATAGFDSRPSPGYARSGGLYAASFQDFTDPDGAYGLQEVDYEAIQHIPIRRDAWVVSFHGLLQTAYSKSGQQIPFFMMPSIGGGDDLRAYSSWRLRDLNSLILQGEWRTIVNRFLDMAVFYDTGRVAPRLDQMKLNDLFYDVGIGFRFHGPAATPLRIELAKGSEGFALVLAAAQAF
jgi:hypothetical protein